jgi:hypothetical protein
MRKNKLTLLVSLIILLFSAAAVSAAQNLLDNGDFMSTLPPREGYQGWADEYIYGWKPFTTAWIAGGHITVIPHPEKPDTSLLRMTGIESGYVALRSHHIPVTEGSMYMLNARALVKELAEPSRFQLFIEFWPADLESETSAFRMSLTKAVAREKGVWLDLEVAETAPEGAATATIMVLIHSQAKLDPLPAEVLVENISFVEVQYP